MLAPVLVPFLLAAGLTGCAGLLPEAKNTVKGPWQSFDEAQQVFAQITPYVTTQADLTDLGLDPDHTVNVTRLNYSDVIRRFVPPGAIDGYVLDPGILDCIKAHDQCRGYEVDQKYLKRDRYGNFWLDIFNFSRKTRTTGWEFNGVLLLKGDTVVYKLTGGRPQVDEDENKKNPLGPLQELNTIKLD